MKPKVSIIIPNFNHKLYLPQRLDSVLGQTLQDFEVIILDDASTDGSQEFLKTYQDHPKVSHIVFNNYNSGSPFKQWEKGIALAKGEYIWVAESDDYCELTFLEHLIPMFQNKKLVLVYSASAIINNDGANLGRHKWADALSKSRWLSDFENNGNSEIRDYLRFRNTITNASAVIFKKSALENVIFPKQLKFCGDWYIWIEILRQGDIGYTHRMLNYFRRHNNTSIIIKDFVNEKQRLHEYIGIFLRNSSFFERLRNFKKYAWMFNEWSNKKKYFPKHSILDLKLPIEFLFYSKLKEKTWKQL